MFGTLAGLILTVSGLGTLAWTDGPLRESDRAVASRGEPSQSESSESTEGAEGAERAVEADAVGEPQLEVYDLRRALRRQQLALAAGLDPALSMSPDWRTDLRQRSALRDALGYDRWRRLGDARFQLQLRHLQGYSEHRDLRDLPMIYEQVEDSLRSNFGKLARDYLEERLGVDDMIDRKRDRLRSRFRGGEGGDDEQRSGGLRISPRLSLGSSSYLGAKFQLRSSPMLSRFGLRVSHAFDSDEMAR